MSIWCIEHAWRHEDEFDPTMKPILEWLQQSFDGFECLYRPTAGYDDLLAELGEWASRGHVDYPILHLANFGDKTDLERFAELSIGLPRADKLRKSKSECAIHFGPTHDLEEMAQVHESRHLRMLRGEPSVHDRSTTLVEGLFEEILATTGAASVSGYRFGYRDGVGLLEGTVSDLGLFFRVAQDCRGPNRQLSSEVMRSAGQDVRNAHFRMKTPGKKMIGGHSVPRKPARRPSR